MKDYFDVSFEVSGHPSSIATCLEVTRAKARDGAGCHGRRGT
ncbi:hypothetical protein SEHO0A_04567 [Salmonella enterica subsp. houtenae str. ATCC BAA-1581]|nr:hypothetical protein SEHO0A_04567 [Salmonella enterica subsp. houtenae str. ATCC BAA-1581]